jgi:hypothetical protein
MAVARFQSQEHSEAVAFAYHGLANVVENGKMVLSGSWELQIAFLGNCSLDRGRWSRLFVLHISAMIVVIIASPIIATHIEKETGSRSKISRSQKSSLLSNTLVYLRCGLR